MPTSEYTPTSTFINNSSPQLTEKEIDDFQEELNHDNNENQKTEVNNDDADNAVDVKWPSKANSNFAKPVSHKDITEAMQKAVPLKVQRQQVQHKETISIVQMFFIA